MTEFLLCCDHHRQIVSAPTLRNAMMLFACKRCVGCEIKTGVWRFKDIRVYSPTAEDRKAVRLEEPRRPRYKSTMDQLDWVTP